jgi:hypothetical protein
LLLFAFVGFGSRPPKSTIVVSTVFSWAWLEPNECNLLYIDVGYVYRCNLHLCKTACTRWVLAMLS